MAIFTLRTLIALAGLTAAIPTNNRRDYSDWKSNIKNVVVLVEENRSFDTFCGGLTYDRKQAPALLLNCFC
jgi:phospholipase C